MSAASRCVDSTAAACSSSPWRPGVVLAIHNGACKNAATDGRIDNGRASVNGIDAINLNDSPEATPNTSAEVGARRHDRFHTSAAADVHRLSGRDCEDYGTQGCVAARSRVGNSNDSVLHQSRREEPQRTTTHRTRAGQADSPAA